MVSSRWGELWVRNVHLMFLVLIANFLLLGWDFVSLYSSFIYALCFMSLGVHSAQYICKEVLTMPASEGGYQKAELEIA
jgi:hypothetical protein